MLARLSRYAVTGGIAALVDAGGFWLATSASVSLPFAAIGSFLLAAAVNYLLTATFVFGRGRTLRGFATFLVFAAIGLTVNVGITLLSAAALHVPPVLAKIAGIGVAFFVNFHLNSRFVFRASHDGMSRE